MMQATPLPTANSNQNYARQRGPPSSGLAPYLHQHHHQQAPLSSSSSQQQQPLQDSSRFMGRLGGSVPYRDDPATTHLESLTPGGYGPRRTSLEDSPYYNDHQEENGKNKHLPWSRKVVNCLLCRHCKPSMSQLSKDDNDQDYYLDDFNDQSWSCSIGTTDDNGIWMNQNDPAGTLMSWIVWGLIGYSALTMTFLAKTGGIPHFLALFYNMIATLALASHAKTSLTDPGAIPPSAVPTESQRRWSGNRLTMCSVCQTFKPPQSHHCRICNRCISRMDHHCPWMNNCVGAGNMKHFILFISYTWTCSTTCLLLLGWNYFFCADESCTFTPVLVQLVRIMTLLSMGAFLFTSSMLMNVAYGLLTGIGTIDRLKKKAQNTMEDSDEDPIPLEDVFGIGPYWTWLLPTDPLLQDYDRIMGYTTPQRLLREQMKLSQRLNGNNHHYNNNQDTPSVGSRDSFGIPV